MEKIKVSEVYVPVDVNERLPTTRGEFYVSTNLVDRHSASYYGVKWEGDLRGTEEEPEVVTHWLERKPDIVLLTVNQLQIILQKTFNAGIARGLYPNQPTSVEYIKSIFP